MATIIGWWWLLGMTWWRQKSIAALSKECANIIQMKGPAQT
jgi:hypothetical protein